MRVTKILVVTVDGEVGDSNFGFCIVVGMVRVAKIVLVTLVVVVIMVRLVMVTMVIVLWWWLW